VVRRTEQKEREGGEWRKAVIFSNVAPFPIFSATPAITITCNLRVAIFSAKCLRRREREREGETEMERLGRAVAADLNRATNEGSRETT